MCTNGVNVDQFKMMLEQMDDQVALNRRWTHKLFHKADDNGYENTAAVLKEIQGLMDEARALLTDAQDQIAHDACIAVRFRLEPESLSAVKGLVEIEIRGSFQANPLGRFHNTHCPDSYPLTHAAGCTRRIRGEI